MSQGHIPQVREQTFQRSKLTDPARLEGPGGPEGLEGGDIQESDCGFRLSLCFMTGQRRDSSGRGEPQVVYFVLKQLSSVASLNLVY